MEIIQSGLCFLPAAKLAEMERNLELDFAPTHRQILAGKIASHSVPARKLVFAIRGHARFTGTSLSGQSFRAVARRVGQELGFVIDIALTRSLNMVVTVVLI